jgi:FAD/FMN-containing dehydrogenase
LARWTISCATAGARLTLDLPGCVSLYYGHIADGNLHIVANVPAARPQPFDRISVLVYDTVRRHGGTISAEHGIGLVKKPYLGYTRSSEELALMKVIKSAIDPRGVLNPGKVL